MASGRITSASVDKKTALTLGGWGGVASVCCGVVRVCGAERARFCADASCHADATLATAGSPRCCNPIGRNSCRKRSRYYCAVRTVDQDRASDYQRFCAAFAATSQAERDPTPSRARHLRPRRRRPTRLALPTWPGERRSCRKWRARWSFPARTSTLARCGEPAEILEAAPGLAVVQHSGSGKANQYYLRGYNLDHGTDMATFWDDVPINLPTNAHGQGYTDLNFLIPETISGLEVRKGPYWADVGDFDNAGALNISLRDSIGQNIQSVTAGSFGYTRLLS